MGQEMTLTQFICGWGPTFFGGPFCLGGVAHIAPTWVWAGLPKKKGLSLPINGKSFEVGQV